MMVGIVGKPNAGKSTFFSAATLIQVPIANYPFTTIKPNRGIAYVTAKCPCREFGVKDDPANSICDEGTRLIPVELVDCAGLVPDAWKGRGLGNRFLDEIRKADAMIHVVDASGSTDLEGRPCPPGSHDPVEDVDFLMREIDMWLFQIVKRDWREVSKGKDARSGLEAKLSGLSIGRPHIERALSDSGLEHKKLAEWADEDLMRFLSRLREISKPTLIAANKIDLPGAEEGLEALRRRGLRAIPCCAEAELALRRSAQRGITNYKPWMGSFKILDGTGLSDEQGRALAMITEKVLKRWGGTGVQEAINSAFFELLNAIVVYPVEDVEKLSDHRGRVLPDAYLVRGGTTARDLAYMIHTELGKGFLYAIDARTGRRLSGDYSLKDGDVISIVSAERRK